MLDHGTRRASRTFQRLGVRTVINAFETVSIVGGTRIHPEVLEAMRDAASDFVFLPELQAAVGKRIAELTRNEGAAVTNGALAGMILATAACLARHDVRGVHGWVRNPPPERNEVVVQRCQYSPYIGNVVQAGARLVEIGYVENRTPEAHLEAALGPRTAAVFYTAGRPYERFAIPLEVVVDIAHQHDVPVIVDAAALLPPAENLWRFTQAGADLAIFSGGKGIQGPQDSGVVVGRKDLTDAIHSINSPIHGVGRALKTTKEDIVGLLVAIELCLAQDPEERYVRLLARARRMADALGDIPHLGVTILPTGRQGQPCPRTVLTLEEGSGWRRQELVSTLRAGDPAILVGELDEDPHAIYLNPLSLDDEEEELVLERIKGLLRARPGSLAE